MAAKFTIKSTIGKASYPIMKWINATQLAEWSKQINARASFIDMVADLIRAGVPDADHFRFPGGDKAQVRGFDGDLECATQLPYIPKGSSKWEFGVSPGSEKVEKDYVKRTTNTPENIRKENTLVLVSLHTWDNGNKNCAIWLKEKKDENAWHDVMFIDGTQLESWLELHPAVAARYARGALRLAPPSGVQSIDEFWDTYSTRFKPTLTEAVLLCDREDQATAILQKLAGTPQAFMYGAESSDDVIAFAVAAIRTAAIETRYMLEARTLIVESTDAVRFLEKKEGLTFITRGQADIHAGMLGRNAPTLSAAVGVQAKNQESLVRPSASSLGKALQTMGFADDDAYQRARNCGRSITILQRQMTSGPIKDPEWLAYCENLLPAIFAGGWSTKSLLDKDMLKALSDMPSYDQFEKGLRPTFNLSDPPIDRVNDVWQIRSPTDALPYFFHLIGEPELKRFKEAAISVFGRPIQQPTADEKFQFSYEAPQDFSSWLRDGLAQTMLQFATIAQDGGMVITNKTPQEFVNEIISELPEWGKSHQTIRALRHQLSIIAEAAPSPFLLALESMLEGDVAEISNIFSESEDFFAPASLHVEILFALETLAWDAKLLPRVSLVLAKLASIDPGGKLMNRPINTLRSIFLSWSPNTYATLDQRTPCIDSIIKSRPQIGWNLLLKLLPSSYDTNDRTRKPRFRDSMPRNPEKLTYGVVWKSNSWIIERALLEARNDENRILALIERMTFFPPPERSKTLDLIDSYLVAHPSEEGHPVWFSLQDKVRCYQAYPQVEWAVPDDELQTFLAVLERHAPQDMLAKMRWLFDDWMPQALVLGENPINKIEIARIEAVEEIKIALGVPGIIKLIERVKLPHLIAATLAESSLSVDECFELFKKLVDGRDKYIDFARTLSGIASQKYDVKWNDYLVDYLRTNPIAPEVVAKLLLNWPCTPVTWQIVSSLGKEVDVAYWKKMETLPQKSNMDDLLFAVNKFRTSGRALDVFGAAFNRISEFSGPLILMLLDEGVGELNANPQRDGTMLSYQIQCAFEVLQQKTDVTIEEIARREYVYLPLLGRSGKELLLHDLMAKDASFYFEIFSSIFRGDDEEQEEPTEIEKARARLSYDLLSTFHTIPGASAEGVDMTTLNDWIHKVRNHAKETMRVDITDQYIGTLLAHCPFDHMDKLWPHTSMRSLLEVLNNDEIERGIVIERFNMRGVHSRAIGEGGAQERELAAKYRNWADGMNSFRRTYAMLQSIADDWDSQASSEDVRAEQEKLKR
ncbi:hypothetical protein [Glaciimonas soli]|uniref:Uncharacterized protein n=1 Tax=Glaciimonas soli TaxID=2590999 RepID=A0A843YYS9_9BURK|nr:hypothetical protein [Glaciimonas soli]MQR02352.1 hypothetical protein [Glaciimonas soli]